MSCTTLRTNLLISNGELALGLLIVIGKVLELLDSFVLGDSDAELDVGLGVLVTRLWDISKTASRLDRIFTYVDLGVVRQRGKRRVQRLVHFLGVSLEESSTSTNEESVSGENSAVVGLLVLEEIADAVLGVAWRVKGLDGDAGANAECLTMLWRRRYLRTVFTTDDWKLVSFQHLLVATGVIPVAVACQSDGSVWTLACFVLVSVDDVGQLDTLRDLLLQNGEYSTICQ